MLLVTHELDEAEALCDRVVVMRDGRILDDGPPAALVARHARWATVRFGWPSPPGTRWRAELRVLPGVRRCVLRRRSLAVHGDRQIIAQVGADLVRRGQIPDDLTVDVPNLESALLDLLDGPAPERPYVLIGAAR